MVKTRRLGLCALSPILPPVLYLLIAAFVFRPFLFDGGIPLGGDWSLPLTPLQMVVYGNSGLYVWTDLDNFLGVRQPYMTDTPFRVFLGALGSLNIDGSLVARLLVVALFTFAGWAMWRYCRFLGCGRLASFAGGMFFGASALFFNYAIMGWVLVLWAFALLPLSAQAFRQALLSGKARSAAVAGLLAAISIQSQGLVWFPLLWLVCLVVSVAVDTPLWVGLRLFALSLGTLILANLFWLPLLLAGHSVVASQASASSAIEGLQLSASGLLRLWGSLYNQPYELSAPSVVGMLAFALTVAVFSVALVRRRAWSSYFHVTLAILPFSLWRFRDLYAGLPFSGVVRDSARFLVLAVFAYATLLALFIQHWQGRAFLPAVRLPVRAGSVVALAAVVLILVNALPFWDSAMFGQPVKQQDIRMRLVHFAPAYFDVERWLEATRSRDKALYLPMGGIVGSEDDPRFHGPFHEFTDLFAAYSPLPGVVSVASRVTSGDSTDFSDLLAKSIQLGSDDYGALLLGLANVKYIVARRDLYSGVTSTPVAETVQGLQADPRFSTVLERGPTVVLQNSDVLPRVYGATTWLMVSGPIEGLARAVLSPAYVPGETVLLLGDQIRDGQPGWLQHHPSPRATPLSGLSFEEINPTKYVVHLDGGRGPFFLVLSESFDPGWRAYVRTGEKPQIGAEAGVSVASGPALIPEDVGYLFQSSLPEGLHFEANGYANAWYVDPSQWGGRDMEITLFFQPQAYFYVGLGVSLLGVTALLAAIVLASWREAGRRRAATTRPRPSDVPSDPVAQ